MQDEQTQIYNRPAVVETRYSQSVRVRFQDNNCMDYVPVDHLTERGDA